MKSSLHSIQATLCPGVKKNISPRQQTITIYQKVTLQSLPTMSNFKIPYAWLCRLGIQKPLEVKKILCSRPPPLTPRSLWLKLACTLRYVGVIWFVFHVLQLLPIRLTQQNSCCISKSLMKHLQRLDRKLDLPLFSYGTYWKCMYVDFLTGEIIGPPNCATIECRVVINVEDIVEPLLYMCLYDVCTLILTNPHTNQISVGGPVSIPFPILIHRVPPLKSWFKFPHM